MKAQLPHRVTGIDVVHCRISSQPSSNDVIIELLSYTEVAVDSDLRSQVLRLCRPNQEGAATNLAEICDLNFALGRQFSHAIEEAGVDLTHVDLIASHGQTLWHQPLGENRSTLQMAEPAVIAQRTKKCFYLFLKPSIYHFPDSILGPLLVASESPSWLPVDKGPLWQASLRPVYCLIPRWYASVRISVE